jgi:hypothetical protein
MDEFHEEFDNRDQETLTLRSDRVFFQEPDQIGLRIDLPISIWCSAGRRLLQELDRGQDWLFLLGQACCFSGQLASSFKTNCLILDIHVPGMSGFQQLSFAPKYNSSTQASK